MQAARLTCLFAVAAAAGLTAASGAQPEAPDTEVGVIVEKALARAAWVEEENFAARFRSVMTQRRREFNGDGEATEDDVLVYAIEPFEGVAYARLITKNGEPISGADLEDERERREEFLKAIENVSDDDDEEDDTDVAFDAELVGRYTATLAGIRDLRGRPSYVLEFEPRADRLPVRRRIDYALNKSTGEIWIDQETYEVARVNFQMTERVRLWWGILGSISNATGGIERIPITDDVWVRSEYNLYYQFRILFRTTRRGETTLWDGFEPMVDSG